MHPKQGERLEKIQRLFSNLYKNDNYVENFEDIDNEDDKEIVC
jgi:hypothetical protein